MFRIHILGKPRELGSIGNKSGIKMSQTANLSLTSLVATILLFAMSQSIKADCDEECKRCQDEKCNSVRDICLSACSSMSDPKAKAACGLSCYAAWGICNSACL